MAVSTEKVRNKNTPVATETERFNMKISPNLLDGVRRAADQDHLSLASWVRLAIKNELRRRARDYNDKEDSRRGTMERVTSSISMP